MFWIINEIGIIATEFGETWQKICFANDKSDKEYRWTLQFLEIPKSFELIRVPCDFKLIN